jgi:hypothetical protein
MIAKTSTPLAGACASEAPPASSRGRALVARTQAADTGREAA